MGKLDEYALQSPGLKGYTPDLKKVKGYEPDVKKVVGYEPEIKTLIVNDPSTPEVERYEPKPYKIPDFGPCPKKVLGYNPSAKKEYPVVNSVLSGYIIDTFMRTWEDSDCEPVSKEQLQKKFEDAGDKTDLDKWLTHLIKSEQIVKVGDRYLPNIYGGCPK